MLNLKNRDTTFYIEIFILVLLLTIAGFIAYTSLLSGTKETRDATRLANLLTINDSLKLYKTKNNTLPLPEDYVNSTASGTILTYQGYFGKSISDKIGISEIKDPLKDDNFKYLNYYTYAIDEKKTSFQLMGFVETQKEISYNPLVKRKPLSYGDKVGIFLEQKTNRPIQEIKVGVDVLNTQDDYIFYIGDRESNFKIFSSYSKNSKIKSCKEISDGGIKKSGVYYINPNGKKTIAVYCDLVSDGGGWTRLYYKNGANTCFNNKINYNESMISNLLTKDFAVSDNFKTLNSEGSWILKDIDFNYMDFSLEKFSNIASCKTPAGDEWTITYDKGYLGIIGTLGTMGSWKSMFYGCDYIRKIGEKGVLFNIGGIDKYGLNGNFIHSICSNYSNKNNSITSRWDWDNTRVIWVR